MLNTDMSLWEGPFGILPHKQDTYSMHSCWLHFWRIIMPASGALTVYFQASPAETTVLHTLSTERPSSMPQ
jgi:hypothetical protein